MTKQFVHLHNHSEYSLLDGASRLKDLVSRSKELNMPAVALTDHGVMYGIVKFYKEAVKQGIKPVIGCEVYVAPKSRFDRKKDDSPFHLTLLAKDMEGYRNLMRLSTAGFLDGFYYKPRIDFEILKQNSKGLIALSGCIKGEVISKINDKVQANEVIEKYLSVFNDDFYLELQNQGLEDQKDINERLVELAKEKGIGIIATNDTHYILKTDAMAQDVLLCVQTGSLLEEKKRLKFSTEEFYLKSYEEMKEAVPYEEALSNSVEIASKCDVEIELDKYYLPDYKIEKDMSLEQYLEEECYRLLPRKFKEVTKEAEERLDFELSVIKKTGFAGYFLVVSDFVRYAKENKIKVGPGRGSAAGSIVSYILDITNINPLEFGLLFERFLNPERISMPDIDIDFCYERRNEVIDYVAKKYGDDKVAQIITFGTMAARAATRDAGRVFNIPYGEVDKIAKLIPEIPGTTIETALKTSADLKIAYDNDETTKRIIDMAKSLEGLCRQDSIHAAGVVLSKEELTNYTPLQRKGSAEIVTQYSMDDIQNIGLLKMDFLGLRTLTVINNAVEIIRRDKGIEIDIDSIPMGDEKTYELLRRGETSGVFQLESSGMKSLLQELKPTEFTDIIAVLALYRPGPLGSGMVKDFVERKHGTQEISYFHPVLESTLKETYGIIVYQEQVMQIAGKMAGFSMAEADILRKAMGKKEPTVLAQQKQKFIDGCVANNIDEKTAGNVFNLVGHFAGYGFNKSHSTAYAYISYQTAYLKANYPVELMASMLTSIMDNKDKVAFYINECRRLKVKILPPDINRSLKGFTVTPDGISFGLSAIRNVGESAIEAIIEARNKKGDFTSIYDFCNKTRLDALNKRTVESLIKSGCFDALGFTRKGLLKVYEKAIDMGIKKQRDIQHGQFSIFDLSGGDVQDESNINDVGELEKKELLVYEKEMLGLYVTDHPLFGLESAIAKNSDVAVSQLKKEKDGSVKTIAGLVSLVKQINTKKGDPMAFVTLEDLVGSVEVVVFPGVYSSSREIIEEDKILRIKGRVDSKEEEAKMLAMTVEEIDEPLRRSDELRSLLISIDSEGYTEDTIVNLKSILSSYPGKNPILMELRDTNGSTKLKLGKEYYVNAQSKLIAELKELLGGESVSLV